MFDSQQWEELLAWSADWVGTDTCQAIRRRQEYIRTARLEDMAFMSEMLYQSKRERTLMVEKYASPYKHELAMESIVATIADLHKLLEIAKNGGDSPIAQRKRYEALMHFDQACILSAIDMADSHYRLSEDFGEFLEAMAARFFSQKDHVVTVGLAFDPSQCCRVSEVAIADPLDADFAVDGLPTRLTGLPLISRTKQQLPCRTFADGRIVYFDVRIKNHYETYLKILWRHSRNRPTAPSSVPDRSGIRLVVPTIQDAMRIAEELERFVRAEGQEATHPTHNFDTDDRGDPDNLESSPGFKAIKLHVRWSRRTHEVQVMTFRDYFSSEYELTNVNHELYKLKRCLDLHFPMFFPSSIYGKDWRDESVRRTLIEEKQRQLRAQIDSY